MSDSTVDSLLFSVIIPVYNNPEDLAKCMECLAAQTLSQDEFEVIVIDNGSSNPPESLVSKYAFARFTTEPKPGSYAARNTGVGIARGKFYAFTDSDCLPASTWLEAGRDALLRPEKIDVVAGHIRVDAQDPSNPKLAELYDIATRFDQQARIAFDKGVVTANMMTRRDVFNVVGPFDDTLMSGADGVWSLRAAELGFNVQYVGEAAVVHPGRDSVSQILLQTRRFAHGRFDLMSRKKNRSPLHWIRLILKKALPSMNKSLVMRKRLQQRGYGMWSWIKVLGVVQLVHYSSTLNQVKKLFHGRSERR